VRSFPPVEAGSGVADGSGMADRNPVGGSEYGEPGVAPVPLTTIFPVVPGSMPAGR
jgi:hypothetical protein